jgi:hypothetical protein
MIVKIIISRSLLVEQSALLPPGKLANESIGVSLAEPQSSCGDLLDADSFVSQRVPAP